MIASLATIKGRERQCEIAERSLRAQVRTFVWKGTMQGRTDDSRKFAPSWMLHKYRGYILTCDDDLKYPPDYAAYMVGMAERHGCPVTLMGRVVNGKSDSYYRDKDAITKYDWRQIYGESKKVDICGTGVFVFHTSMVSFDWSDFPHENMSDILASIKLRRAGVDIVRVDPPRLNWIQYLDVPDTIYDKHRNADKIQTELVNSINWKNGR